MQLILANENGYLDILLVVLLQLVSSPKVNA